MTYNFDPDGWYDRQRALLDGQVQRGELDREAFTAAVEELDRRYDEMVARLDRGYFKIDAPK